jgi:hypothetical protein
MRSAIALGLAVFVLCSCAQSPKGSAQTVGLSGTRAMEYVTLSDTLDRISPESMEKVGKLVLAMLPQIQAQR